MNDDSSNSTEDYSDENDDLTDEGERLTTILSKDKNGDLSSSDYIENEKNIKQFKRLKQLSQDIYESLQKDLDEKNIKQRLADGLSL